MQEATHEPAWGASAIHGLQQNCGHEKQHTWLPVSVAHELLGPTATQGLASARTAVQLQTQPQHNIVVTKLNLATPPELGVEIVQGHTWQRERMRGVNTKPVGALEKQIVRARVKINVCADVGAGLQLANPRPC